jgi:hypothetical protein
MAHLSRFQAVEYVPSTACEDALPSTLALLFLSNCLLLEPQGGLRNVIAPRACSHGRKRPDAAIRRHCTTADSDLCFDRQRWSCFGAPQELDIHLTFRISWRI